MSISNYQEVERGTGKKKKKSLCWRFSLRRFKPFQYSEFAVLLPDAPSFSTVLNKNGSWMTPPEKAQIAACVVEPEGFLGEDVAGGAVGTSFWHWKVCFRWCFLLYFYIFRIGLPLVTQMYIVVSRIRRSPVCAADCCTVCSPCYFFVPAVSSVLVCIIPTATRPLSLCCQWHHLFCVFVLFRSVVLLALLTTIKMVEKQQKKKKTVSVTPSSQLLFIEKCIMETCSSRCYEWIVWFDGKYTFPATQVWISGNRWGVRREWLGCCSVKGDFLALWWLVTFSGCRLPLSAADCSEKLDNYQYWAELLLSLKCWLSQNKGERLEIHNSFQIWINLDLLGMGV